MLPRVWISGTGLLGLLKRSREGVLAMTNKKLVFVAKHMIVTRDEMSRYIDLKSNTVKVSVMRGYSEKNLDEDISDDEKGSVLIPLISITDVREVNVRRSRFLRVTFMKEGKSKAYDYGIAESVTSYLGRQPLLFYDISWEPWVRLINAYR